MLKGFEQQVQSTCIIIKTISTYLIIDTVYLDLDISENSIGNPAKVKSKSDSINDQSELAAFSHHGLFPLI